MKEVYGFSGVGLFVRMGFVCAALYCASSVAYRTDYNNLTEADLKMLPPFCRTGFSSYDIQNKEFLNHLCPALAALNNAKSIFGDDNAKKAALAVAESGLTYTLDNVKTFPWRSTVLVKRGEAYEMQGNIAKAIGDYREAIRVSQKNAFAYLALADAYAKTGQRKEALQVIEQALKIAPGSKALLAKKERLSK